MCFLVRLDRRRQVGEAFLKAFCCCIVFLCIKKLLCSHSKTQLTCLHLHFCSVFVSAVKVSFQVGVALVCLLLPQQVVDGVRLAAAQDDEGGVLDLLFGNWIALKLRQGGAVLEVAPQAGGAIC